MNLKKSAPIAVAVIGVVFMLFSGYISKHVTEGKMQIEMGKKKIDTTNSVFSMSKYTKPVGEKLTESGKKKIRVGQQEVSKYEKIADVLWYGGIILIIAGAGTFYYRRKKGA